MKITLIGASGNVGSRILKELSDRGHAITAIARQPERIAAQPGATAVTGGAVLALPAAALRWACLAGAAAGAT